jgi:hypothetical protein
MAGVDLGRGAAAPGFHNEEGNDISNQNRRQALGSSSSSTLSLASYVRTLSRMITGALRRVVTIWSLLRNAIPPLRSYRDFTMGLTAERRVDA